MLSWTSTTSLADGAGVVDAALQDRAEVDDEFELDDRLDALDADGKKDMDEIYLVGEMFEDVMAGKEHAFPPHSVGLTSFQLSLV